MSLRLVISVRAEAQLDKLFGYLVVNASLAVAERFVGAILDRLQGLENAPLQGTTHDHVLPGLRTIGFRRRVTIAFRVDEAEIIILGVFYGGQNFEAALRDS